MRSSVDRDNNYCCHYVILRNAGFAITLHYHPARYIYICYYYDSNKKCYDALVIFGEQASLLACLDLDNMSRYALYIASSM
jgi:hypothetical protein